MLTRKYLPTEVKVDLAGRFYLPQTLAATYLKEYRAEVISTAELFDNIKDGTYHGYAITWQLRPASCKQFAKVRLSFRSPHRCYNDIDRVLITGIKDHDNQD
jgi:hypothetical protein